MRVLWVTNDLPPRAGGIEQFIGNLLARVHPDSTLVIGPANPDGPAHDVTQPYEVRRLDGSVLPTPDTLRAVREAARDHTPDVVVFGASWPLGELAGPLSSDPGVPMVSLTHGLEAGLCRVGLGVLVRRATRHLDAVTTISDFTEDALAPHLGTDQVVRVPPGVDVERFRPGVDRGGMRRRWGVPDDARVVGCVSRLVRRKGQDVLLEVWPHVAERRPDAWLVLVGEGPLEDTLRATAVSLPRVVVAGRADWDDLPAAHASFDVFAMPCRTRLLGTDVEGLGIVYLEAQACGVPAIAGRSGGAPEAVRAGETGLVVDGTDRAEVLRAVGDLLDDPDRRAAYGAKGRRWVEAVWSWEDIARRFADLLDEVVGS